MKQRKIICNVITKSYDFVVKFPSGREDLMRIEAESEEAAALKIPQDAVKYVCLGETDTRPEML